MTYLPSLSQKKPSLLSKKISCLIKLKFHSFALYSKDSMSQKNQQLDLSPLMSCDLALNGFHLQF